MPMISTRRQRNSRARALFATGLLLIAGVALLPLLHDDAPAGQDAKPAPVAGHAAPPARIASTAPTPSVETVAVDAALLATPEARSYLERERFNERARRFFAEAAQLDPASRAREAQWIESAVDTYERARQLSAGEAMNLRLGLIDANGLSESDRAEQMAGIVMRYQLDGERREAHWAAQQSGDAAFAHYKSREQAIVAEVMALARIPDGLSRDEYLRRRLEAERIAAMR
jgi:hypothetical protein